MEKRTNATEQSFEISFKYVLLPIRTRKDLTDCNLRRQNKLAQEKC